MLGTTACDLFYVFLVTLESLSFTFTGAYIAAHLVLWTHWITSTVGVCCPKTCEEKEGVITYRQSHCLAPHTASSRISGHSGFSWNKEAQHAMKDKPLRSTCSVWPHHSNMDSQDCPEQWPGVPGLKLCVSYQWLQVRAECSKTLCEAFWLARPEVSIVASDKLVF